MSDTTRDPLKVTERHLKQLQRIARKHKLDPQEVLDRILNDCVDGYLGRCTVTCGFCHMEEDLHAK